MAPRAPPSLRCPGGEGACPRSHTQEAGSTQRGHTLSFLKSWPPRTQVRLCVQNFPASLVGGTQGPGRWGLQQRGVTGAPGTSWCPCESGVSRCAGGKRASSLTPACCGAPRTFAQAGPDPPFLGHPPSSSGVGAVGGLLPSLETLPLRQGLEGASLRAGPTDAQ